MKEFSTALIALIVIIFASGYAAWNGAQIGVNNQEMTQLSATGSILEYTDEMVAERVLKMKGTVLYPLCELQLVPTSPITTWDKTADYFLPESQFEAIYGIARTPEELRAQQLDAYDVLFRGVIIGLAEREPDYSSIVSCNSYLPDNTFKNESIQSTPISLDGSRYIEAFSWHAELKDGLTVDALVFIDENGSYSLGSVAASQEL